MKSIRADAIRWLACRMRPEIGNGGQKFLDRPTLDPLGQSIEIVTTRCDSTCFATVQPEDCIRLPSAEGDRGSILRRNSVDLRVRILIFEPIPQSGHTERPRRTAFLGFAPPAENGAPLRIVFNAVLNL